MHMLAHLPDSPLLVFISDRLVPIFAFFIGIRVRLNFRNVYILHRAGKLLFSGLCKICIASLKGNSDKSLLEFRQRTLAITVNVFNATFRLSIVSLLQANYNL